MEFVLDHEIGRRERRCQLVAASWVHGTVEAVRVRSHGPPHEQPRFSREGQRRELVDRGDQERREATIDHLVHGEDGQVAVSVELAVEVRADHPQLVRLIGSGLQIKRVRLETLAAPGTVLQGDRRRVAIPIGLVAQRL